MHARRRRSMTAWCWRVSKAPNSGRKNSEVHRARDQDVAAPGCPRPFIDHQPPALVVLDALKVHPLIHRGSCRFLMWERVLNNINLLKWDLVSGAWRNIAADRPPARWLDFRVIATQCT